MGKVGNGKSKRWEEWEIGKVRDEKRGKFIKLKSGNKVTSSETLPLQFRPSPSYPFRH